MPLGQVARCFLCHRLVGEEEIILNRINWEYQCRDSSACLERRTNEGMKTLEKIRKRSQTIKNEKVQIRSSSRNRRFSRAI